MLNKMTEKAARSEPRKAEEILCYRIGTILNARRGRAWKHFPSVKRREILASMGTNTRSFDHQSFFSTDPNRNETSLGIKDQKEIGRNEKGLWENWIGTIPGGMKHCWDTKRDMGRGKKGYTRIKGTLGKQKKSVASAEERLWKGAVDWARTDCPVVL